ncbi:MAG: transposase [Candidatus Azotimanducaceae bacterium WSBS_2022_MAG_OTU7]
MPTSDNRAKTSELVSKQAGFSLHAGVACKSNQRKKLERLCRYITSPAIAEQRLSLTSNGGVIVALKTPYDDGASHVVLSPIEFMGHQAALVPRPPLNLTTKVLDYKSNRSKVITLVQATTKSLTNLSWASSAA